MPQMPKLSAEFKEQVKQAVRHPVVWWKGESLPEEKLHPWEYGIQFLSELFPGFMNGFFSLQRRLFVGDGKNKVRYNHKTIADVSKTIWDGLNDPLIGMYLDRKGFGAQMLRRFMRVAALFCPLFDLLQCFDLGLSPLQRLISWILIDIISNSMWTANEVSSAKIWAGITPHSEQRGHLQMSRSVGTTIGALFSGLPWAIIGFAPNLGLHLTEYQVMIWGAAIFAPLTIFSRWLPSTAKQRVDFTVKVRAEGEVQEEGAEQEDKKLTLRENFSIIKYNRWFMMWLVIDFLRVLIPSNDRMFIYQFLIPGKNLFGKYYTGIALKSILDVALEWPSFVMTPLGPKMVKLLGGPVGFIKTHVVVSMATQILSFIAGYKTWPRLILMKLLEMSRDAMQNWSSVAHNMIEYEMFDYVEWKTGYRSEGVTKSIDGILKKFIKNNIGTIFGNAVMDWTGFVSWDTPAEKQPKRFLDSIWPLQHIGPIFGEAVALVALLRFKYPHDPKEVEADLLERRALARKIQEEMEST